MNGVAVRAVRISKGMTQEDFAKILNVSRSCIAAVESGFRPVSPALRIKIAQTFGTGEDITEAITRARESEKLAL